MIDSAPAASAAPPHAYPRDLAVLTRRRWEGLGLTANATSPAPSAQASALPSPFVLERLLSVCYQASLLHEEGRPITFRVAIAGSEAFIATEGPPAGLHRLVFSRPRPFDEHEIRRLAPAAAFQRSLIGVSASADGELEVWGLIHCGPRWLQAVRGGRRIDQYIPPVLMAAVTGPGRVLVSRGTRTLASLANGMLGDPAIDAFDAPWLSALFDDLGAAQWAEHAPVPPNGPERPAAIDRRFGQKLAKHVLRRIVATIRGARHGGTLILVPSAGASELLAAGHYLKAKYRFQNEEPRRRIFNLTVQIMNELTGLPSAEAGGRVGWLEYEASTNSRLAALDEALFEVAHLVAMLADVDGAVVITNQLEILGFGAEISGAVPEVESVDRSLDLEGTERVEERTDRVGTRHRSSYRLCQELHEALVIVVSQDGGVRFVRWQAGRVTYFDQIATGPWEV